MNKTRAYCDWNATAPLLPAAGEAMARAHDLGNPSSIYAEGRAARAAVEQGRADVAAWLGVAPAQVTFTSGGTEAAATLLQPVHIGDVLLTGAAEHACVLAGGGYAPEHRAMIGVDDAGRLSVDDAKRMASTLNASAGAITVAVQIANNETGTINGPEIFAELAGQGWRIIADAVQAAGRIDLGAYLPHCDALFVSAHKIGGPKGVGAFVTRAGACGIARPLIGGGGQEKGLRGGTENVAGIAGFGVAARHAAKAVAAMDSVRALRDSFERRLAILAPDAHIFAASVARLPNTSLFAIPGLRAETALIAFDLDGVAVSSGSACSSGKVGRSHVLAAMGVSPDLVAGAIRVSFGDRSTEAERDAVLNSLERQLVRRQSCRPAA